MLSLSVSVLVLTILASSPPPSLADLSTLFDPSALHHSSHSSSLPHASHPSSHASPSLTSVAFPSPTSVAFPTGGYGAPEVAPQNDNICTDVSYVKPIEYVPGETCCTTKVVEPYCQESVKKVTKEVTETVCELIPTPKCQMSSCPVEVTFPEQYEKSFEPWACELRPKILYHYKTLPVCHNVSKPICIEEWKTDYTTGERYKVVTDNCEHAYWEECEDQQKKVAFQTMESQCWKDKEIWYESCREVTSPVNMMCWSCEADAVPKCDSQTRLIDIDVMEKTCEPRTETTCDPPKKTPTQEKVHQEKCLNHSPSSSPSHSSSPSSYHGPTTIKREATSSKLSALRRKLPFSPSKPFTAFSTSKRELSLVPATGGRLPESQAKPTAPPTKKREVSKYSDPAASPAPAPASVPTPATTASVPSPNYKEYFGLV